MSERSTDSEHQTLLKEAMGQLTKITASTATWYQETLKEPTQPILPGK